MREFFRGLAYIAVFSVGTMGCGDGSQHGKFMVASSPRYALAEHAGFLCCVLGGTNVENDRTDVPLLYILVVGGDIPSASHLEFVSGWSITWMTPDGAADTRSRDAKFSWDRKSDEVKIGGRAFPRSQGNAFVVSRDSSGNVATTQIDGVMSGAEANGVLREIQASLPANSPVKDAAIMKR